MDPLLRLLEPLIGRPLQLDGLSGTVVDVLADPPALVLATDQSLAIECDHLGRPQQQSGINHTISLLSPQGSALAAEIQRQLPEPLARTLHALLIDATDEPHRPAP